MACIHIYACKHFPVSGYACLKYIHACMRLQDVYHIREGRAPVSKTRSTGANRFQPALQVAPGIYSRSYLKLLLWTRLPNCTLSTYLQLIYGCHHPMPLHSHNIHTVIVVCSTDTHLVNNQLFYYIFSRSLHQTDITNICHTQLHQMSLILGNEEMFLSKLADLSMWFILTLTFTADNMAQLKHNKYW